MEKEESKLPSSERSQWLDCLRKGKSSRLVIFASVVILIIVAVVAVKYRVSRQLRSVGINNTQQADYGVDVQTQEMADQVVGPVEKGQVVDQVTGSVEDIDIIEGKVTVLYEDEYGETQSKSMDFANIYWVL